MKRRILQIGCVLLWLFLIVFITWRIKLAHEVSRKLEAIQAAGLPISGAELNAYYPHVPESENAALIVTQAFAFMANYPDGRSNAITKLKLPTASVPLTMEQRQLLAGYVELNRTAIQKAKSGLLLVKSRYPIDLSPGMAAFLPHLAPLMHLAQAVSYDGILDAENGQQAEAIQSVGTIIQLSKTLVNEPVLISVLVRFRMDKMAKVTFERCLNAQQPEEKNLTALDQVFPDWEETNGLYQAMIGEQAIAIPVFQMDFPQFSRFAESNDNDIRNTRKEPRARLLTLLLRGSGFFQRDLRFYLTTMETNINLSKTPPPENFAITNVWNNALREIERRHLIMSAILLPGLDLAYFRNAESIADIRLSKLALAIERFRNLHGRLPTVLDQLGDLAPLNTRIDPFDGQPLRYKHLAKGYVIYSVAKDGQDNGGRERPADAKSSDKTEYDITFTVER